MTIADSLLRTLTAEAAALRFSRTVNNKFAMHRGHRKLTSPFDLALADSGGACLDFARSAETLSRIRHFSTGRVTNITCTYLAYAVNSYMGCHTDRIGSDVNLLVPLAGGETLFELHPDHQSTGMDELLAMVQHGRGFLADPQQIELKVGMGVIFSGRKVPHQRRPTPTPLLLLGVCYTLVPVNDT